MKLKREAVEEKNMKGYILTLEALMSLFIVILLLSSLPLTLGRKETGLNSFIILADSFEVLEKKYHNNLAEWVTAGQADPELVDYFEFIRNSTGRKVYLGYSGRSLPDYGCVPETSMRRMVVTPDRAGGAINSNTITISVCG